LPGVGIPLGEALRQKRIVPRAVGLPASYVVAIACDSLDQAASAFICGRGWLMLMEGYPAAAQ
jgi:hypothetical protein